MGTLVLKCPLCCGETFTCQKSLCDHLLNLVNNLVCPSCCSKFEEILDLVNHLSGKNGSFCKKYSNNSTAKVNESKESLHFSKSPISDENGTSFEMGEVENKSLSENANMEKISLKKILQSADCQENDVDHQRVTLLGEDSESHIIIVAEQSDSEDGMEESLMETEDETIVVTSEKSKIDSEAALDDNDQLMSRELEEGLYSCTSCSMSFTSVIEHIQTYHTDQEVVLEMTDDNKLDTGACNDAVSFLQAMADRAIDPIKTDDNKTIKYIITNEGDIVEAEEDVKEPIAMEKPLRVARKGGKQPRASVKEEPCLDKDGRQYIRRVIRIEKFWENKAKEEQLKNSDKKKNLASPGTVRMPQVSSGNSSLMLDVGPNDATVVKQKNHLVMFQCSTCNVTLNANEVKGHVCYTAPYKYACPHCPVSYASPKSLCAHMKIHKEVKSQEKKAKQSASDPNLATFQCDICDTIFPSNKSLRLHGRMHEPLRSRHVDAPVHYMSEHNVKDENSDILNTVSGELSIDSSGQKKDMEDNHKDMYLCLLCDKWIHCGYREIHNNYHTSGNEFNCDICNRKFFTADNLMMHMNVHNNEKAVTQAVDKVLPYQCLYCNRQFTRPHEKVKHERIHTGEKPHSCDICGKSFRVSYCLTLHMRTHTGARPYVCGHCGKRFKAHSVYNHHLLTHSDVRAYKCCFCPKAFKTSVQLAGHKNSHTKPFACTQCNRPFASLYAVRVHMETHQRQNNLKYCCGLCGASYARAFALKDHVRSQHSCEMVEYSTSSIIEDAPSEGPSVSFDTKETVSFDIKESLTKLEPEDSVATISILPKNESYEVTEDMDINCTPEIELLGDPLGT